MQTRSDLFPADLARLAETARVLANPARLVILETLAARGSCVCGEVVDVLPLAQATVSQHLKALRDAGLVRGEVDGPRSCYCLDPDGLRAAAGALAAFLGALTPDASDGDSDGPDCC